MIATMPFKNKRLFLYNKLLWVVVLVALFATFVSIATITKADWTGGYVSETLISRQGVTDSNFTIDTSTTTGSYLDVATVGTISTGEATGIGTKSADLHTTISSLNGSPRATVYFEWGYDASYGNSTTSTIITAPGNVTLPITGYNPSHDIYYRAVVETDGKARGAGRFFHVGGMSSGFDILNTIVLLGIAIAMLLVAIKLITDQNITGLEIMVLLMILAVCYFVIQQIIDQI